MTAKIDNEWCRCGKCGHKLFKIIWFGAGMLEIKCSSCKTINVVWKDESEDKEWKENERRKS